MKRSKRVYIRLAPGQILVVHTEDLTQKMYISYCRGCKALGRLYRLPPKSKLYTCLACATDNPDPLDTKSVKRVS